MKTNNEVINTLLEQVQPAFEKYWEKELEKMNAEVAEAISLGCKRDYFNESYIQREKEFYFDSLTFDLVKSFGKYFKKTDKLNEFYTPRFQMGKTGFTVDLFVERESKAHSFRTEAILAGGYNIQCLHIRYIAHTNLPCLLENKPLIYLTNTQKIEENKRYIKNIEQRIQDILFKKDTEKVWTQDVWYDKKNMRFTSQEKIPKMFKQHQNWCKRGYLTDIKHEEKEIAKYQAKIDKWQAEI